MRRSLTFTLLTLAVAAVVAGGWLFAGRNLRLPFDGMNAVEKGEWQDFGGLWNFQNSIIFNRSDEVGAKLVTGSPRWSNYRVSADMRMLGHRGEVGIIVRVNDMRDGINAYRGYYAGYRSADNSLILGFSDRDWVETRPVPLAAPILSNDWMHMDVVAFGCDIAAELTVIRTGETVRSLIHQEACVAEGRIGLRSLASGGAWKNITVTRAMESDIAAVRHFVPVSGKAVFPSREDDLTAMLMGESATPDRFLLRFLRGEAGTHRLTMLADVRSIASLDTVHGESRPATLQGAVTHVNPLYIQDASGGIAVHSAAEDSLNLGDEVEVTGLVVRATNDVFLDATSFNVLWDDDLPKPVAITSDQAASGLFEGSLVELSGKLLSRTASPGSTIRLRMSSGQEQFSVIVPQSLSKSAIRAWPDGSMLRVRGVCASEQHALDGPDLFRILPRSVADIHMVAGPPWNSGIRLAMLIALSAAMIAMAIFAVLRAERWKMHAIYEERERLSADMHDTLAQGFAGVSYQLQSLRRGLKENVEVPGNLMRRLDTACELATETHREASTRITALHFAAGEQYDVLDVLQRALTLMLGTESTLVIKFERIGAPRFLSLATRDALSRVGHEAIANVLRHSRATLLLLILEFQPAGVLLQVEDNGVGFDDRKQGGFGMGNMRTRAEDAGGELKVFASPGTGTKVSVYIPYGTRRNTWGRVSEVVAGIFRPQAPTAFRRPN